MAGRREMEASSRRLGLVRPFMRDLNLHMYERRLSHEHLSCGSDRVDQGGMSRPRRRPGLSDVYAAWIELNLASKWQQPGGRRRQKQAAPGVTLWWPGPAGGSGRPIVSLKV